MAIRLGQDGFVSHTGYVTAAFTGWILWDECLSQPSSPPLKKTCVSPSGNWRWLRKLLPADRGTSVPWRKLSDGRGEVAVAAATGQRHVVQLLAGQR